KRAAEKKPSAHRGVVAAQTLRLAVLADLVADRAAYGCATDRASDSTPGSPGARHTAQARTRHGAFLAVAHVVPRRAAGQGDGKNAGCCEFSPGCQFHFLSPRMRVTAKGSRFIRPRANVHGGQC